MQACCECPKMAEDIFCGLQFLSTDSSEVVLGDFQALYYVNDKNGIKFGRTFEMLTVTFGESSMSRTQVQLWHNRLNEGREDVKDDARPGRPSTSTNDKSIEAVK